MNTTDNFTSNTTFDINCSLTAKEIIDYIYTLGLFSVKKPYVDKYNSDIAEIIKKNIGGNVTLTDVN